ncbi:hypothetical protein C8F01DRAFT_1256101 [Mycena amicta]|nr:hypothetical protein C8F01DRAFT_1256101 [Mycena amicta]
MPLFTSNNPNPNKLEKRTGATELSSTDYAAGGPTSGTMAGGPGARTTNDPYLANETGTVGMGEPGMGQPGMGGQSGMGMGQPGMAGGGRHHAHGTDMMGDPAYAGTGTGAAGIPPSHAINSGTHTGTGTGTGTGSGGGATTGKIEHAIGSIVGSKSLKAKGIQKEQEARALKVQSSELAEAERLERESGMRRERAVAHGAHPDNRHVGGGGMTGGPGAYD